MQLTRVPPVEVEPRGVVTPGVSNASPDEILADALREEVFAARLVTRTALLERVRVRRSLGDTAGLAEVLDRLLACGDLLSGPQGRIAPAPARIVELLDGALMLLGGIPTALLPERAGLAQVAPGLPRPLIAGETAERDWWRGWLADQGGRWLGVVRWSGLDRVPSWQTWLGELESRRALDETARSGPVTSPEHEVFLVDARRPRWPRRWRATMLTGGSALVRARREHGWSYGLAWHDGERARGFALSSDEARRTYCALAAAAGCPVPIREQQEGARVLLSFEPWLPDAERRALRVSAKTSEPIGPGRYRLPLARWQGLRPWLETITGMTKDSDGG